MQKTIPTVPHVLRVKKLYEECEFTEVCLKASRELGIPCVIGTKNASKLIKSGKLVTVSCAEGEEEYVCMNEKIFIPDEVVKILSDGRFGSIYTK